MDLGSIFDLAGLRPFNSLHLIPPTNAPGVDGVAGLNVHSIVLQVPITDLTRNHQTPSGPSDPIASVGIYASARRSSTRILYDDGTQQLRGKEVQVSRLGMPLVNEVIIPLGQKDYWNAQDPADEGQFQQRYLNPELAGAGELRCIASWIRRHDEPPGPEGDLPDRHSRPELHRQPRIRPAAPEHGDPALGGVRNRLGAIAGQLDGFPNGRRLVDDIVDIEIRATAEGYGPILNGLLGLPNRSPNNLLGDGVDANDKPFLSSFPYVAGPFQGYEQQPPVFIQLANKEGRVMGKMEQ